MSGSSRQQIQTGGFYWAGFISLALAGLKLTEMKQWSWWRVLLPVWAILGHDAIYLLVGFLCLFAVRHEEEEAPSIQNDHILFQVASLVCVLISMDNSLRWLERGRESYWFWLCSGRMTMVILFGILALGAQFLYWGYIVQGLNNQLAERNGQRVFREKGSARVHEYARRD